MKDGAFRHPKPVQFQTGSCSAPSLGYAGRVSGFTDRDYFAWAVVLYGICTLYSVFLWRKGFRTDNRIIYILLLAAAGVHGIAMVKRGVSLARCPVNDLFGATMFVGWVIALTYLAIGLWRKLRFVGVFASPILLATGVFALMFAINPKPTTATAAGPWTSSHAAIILLSYGAFGLSAIASMMYLTQEHNLKFNKLRAVFSLLPPIQRLELVIWRTVIAGFILLTLGLLMGAAGLHQTRGTFLVWDWKIAWSAAVWCFYLGLLALRWRFAQTGRRLAWSAFGSFCFILLTFWGFNLLSGIHHP